MEDDAIDQEDEEEDEEEQEEDDDDDEEEEEEEEEEEYEEEGTSSCSPWSTRHPCTAAVLFLFPADRLSSSAARISIISARSTMRERLPLPAPTSRKVVWFPPRRRPCFQICPAMAARWSLCLFLLPSRGGTRAAPRPPTATPFSVVQSQKGRTTHRSGKRRTLRTLLRLFASPAACSLPSSRRVSKAVLTRLWNEATHSPSFASCRWRIRY